MFNEVRNCRYGNMLYNVNDQYVGGSLKRYGEFSEGECDFFRKVISPGDIVMDIGANIGCHTVFFAKHDCIVLAFEPQRIVFQALCANVAINSIASAYCYNAGLSDSSGHIIVPDLDPRRPNNFGGLSIESHDDGDIVPVQTIDCINLPRCALIKIDVEGMEEKVLKGGSDTICRLKPVLYVENDRADKSDSLINYIESLGYNWAWHTPYLYNPENYYGSHDNVFPNIVSKNLICVHKNDARQELLNG